MAPPEQIRKFRAYNERKLKDFLYYLDDYYEQLYTARTDEIATLGEGTILGAWLHATMRDPELRASHKVLMECVQYLKHSHRRLYIRLLPAFFAYDDPFAEQTSDPSLPALWEKETNEGNAEARDAYRDYLEAIIHMMDYIEARLPTFKRIDEKGRERPILRLKVPVPSTHLYTRSSRKRSSRRHVAEKVQEFREDLDDDVAIKLAAARYGYSPKEVRVIIKQHDEGKL